MNVPPGWAAWGWPADPRRGRLRANGVIAYTTNSGRGRGAPFVRFVDPASGQVQGTIPGATRLTFSPDGCRHAWYGTDDNRVWVTAAAPGAPPIALTPPDPGFTLVREITWSPDGQRLAFVATRDAAPAGGDVFTLVSTTHPTTPRGLTERDWVDSPTWAPDSRTLAYAANLPTTGSELFVQCFDGTGRRRLTKDAMWQLRPAWSPDGCCIAYVAYEGLHDYTPGIGAMHLRPDPAGWKRAGHDLVIAPPSDRQLTSNPTWSPAGTQVLTSWYAPGSPGRPATREIVIYEAPDDEQQPAVERRTGVPGGSAIWSPDGTRIAYLDGDALWTMATARTTSGTITEPPTRLVATGAHVLNGWQPVPQPRSGVA